MYKSTFLNSSLEQIIFTSFKIQMCSPLSKRRTYENIEKCSLNRPNTSLSLRTPSTIIQTKSSSFINAYQKVLILRTVLILDALKFFYPI